MVTAKQGPIDVGEVEVPTSPTEGQADPRQNQPPTATPNKFVAISSGCKTDAEGPVRPRETIYKYRVESEIKPCERQEVESAGLLLT